MPITKSLTSGRARRVLGAVLMTAACGGGGLGEMPVISAQLVDTADGTWSYGAGYNLAFGFDPEGINPHWIGKVPVAADGHFSATLPTGRTFAQRLVPFDQYLGIRSCRNIRMDSPLAKVVSIGFLPQDGGSPLTAVQIGDPFVTNAGKAYVFVYSDLDFNVTGEGFCTGPSPYLYFDVHLKAGWNVMLSELDVPNYKVAFSTTTLPDDTKWFVSRRNVRHLR